MKNLLAVSCLMAAFALGAACAAQAAAPAVDWERLYGDSLRQIANWVEEHSYNGYLVCGSTQIAPVLTNRAFLMRQNSNGDTLWMKTYNDSISGAATCVRETRDRGYILAGYLERTPTDLDAWFIRTDANGDTLWTSRFDFGRDELLYCVEETDDGGFIASGFVATGGAPPPADVLVLKIDADGDGEWKLICGGPAPNRGYCMCRTGDGNYVVAGYTEVGADPSDLFLLKVDGNDGDSLWAVTYGSPGKREMARQVKETGGGLIVTGAVTDDVSGAINGFLLKTEDDGDSLWMRTYGGTASYLSFGSVLVTPDLGYMVGGSLDAAGDGNSDYYFMKTDSAGDTLWTKTVGYDTRDYLLCATTAPDLGYVAVGYSREITSSDYDIYLVKLGTDDAGAGPIETFPPQRLLTLDGACPFRNEVSIYYEMPAAAAVGLKVYDVHGRLVAVLVDGMRPEGLHRETWDCCNASGARVSDGVYFIRCLTAGRSEVQKALVLQ
jgi:hypothetical protein